VPLLLAGNLIAFLLGFAKTGLPGMGILAVVLMANTLDQTRLSVGVMLPLLIVADLCAVAIYRSHAQWGLIRRLMPWVLAGVALGAVALDNVRGQSFNVLLGGLVLVLIGLDLLRQRLGWHALPHHPAFGALLGVATGFATTIGNVAGPVMTLYLISQGLDKNRFMGSMAWFFLLLNSLKVPIFVWQGMITEETLGLDARLLPGVFVGALIGRLAYRHIPQQTFNRLVLLLAALSALHLVLA
jgi:uncharacterized membrane protein YfcA